MATPAQAEERIKQFESHADAAEKAAASAQRMEHRIANPEKRRSLK
jgi:hypothetical protein